ncbi:MAG: aminopeptidase N [Mycobacteriales bacterium]
MPHLTRAEAVRRKELLAVTSYHVELDLTRGPEVFGSRTTVHFSCAEPGQSSFAELISRDIRSMRLGDRELDPSSTVEQNRITLDDLGADNVLTVEADCIYSRTGEGLHRFTDPADGEVYTYSQSFLNDAQRIFACFDQPDLKAPFTLRVHAPEDWTVLSNAAGVQVAQGLWEFPETPPLATYLTAVVGGPYHSVSQQHGDITLGLHCRRSMAEHLEPDELFELTRQCFDYQERLFDSPYPFGPSYDQVFVPEFNAGAMENAGCVTFRDEFLYRSRATKAARQQRAMIIAHEMAHMWFGDLVTLRWWDDIWLNESFATYIGFLTAAEATRFTGAWTEFVTKDKAFGYRQDQLPTTHPISSEAPDTASALLNFDGISYAKGASVLKQLVAWVGFEQFMAGVRDYFDRHAHGNTSLTDLLSALERTSGRDLRSWSAQWLQTAGVNTLRADTSTDADGNYTAVAIEQRAPAAHPMLRPHRVSIGLYDSSGPKLVRRERIELDVVGARTPVPELTGLPAADLLLLNDEDLTWAKLRLDPGSTDTMFDGGIMRLEDSLTRALLWGSAWDMTVDAELSPGDYLRLVLDGLPAETETNLIEQLLKQARRAIDAFSGSDVRDERLRALNRSCRTAMDAARPGGDLQLSFARGYVDSALHDGDVGALRAWLDGSDAPTGLPIDADLRWRIVRRLAALGVLSTADIDGEYARDTTSAGALSAATARASLPTAEAKEAAWSALVESDALSNHLVAATADGFWQREHTELGRPFVERYFAQMPDIWRRRTPQIAVTLTSRLYPGLLVEPPILQRTDQALSAADLDAGLRRGWLEQQADLARAVRARDLDA